MNRLRLKKVGLVALIFAVIGGVWFFKGGESARTGPVEGVDEVGLEVGVGGVEAKRSGGVVPGRGLSAGGSEFERGKVEQLRRTADSLKAVYRNPNSGEAVKARESLMNVRQGPQKADIVSAKAARSRFLNKPGPNEPTDPTTAMSPQQGEHQAVTAAGPYLQPPVDSGAGNLRGLSQNVLKDHLTNYRITRNDMFPMYPSSLPVGLLHRLPSKYRRQPIGTTGQRSLWVSGRTNART